MKTRSGHRMLAFALFTASLIASGPALPAANEPAQARDGANRVRNDEVAAPRSGHFQEQQRAVVRDYFDKQSRTGKCPPGLARKSNGCNPPGQVKQWQLGQQLSPEVTWYELTRELELQLGQAPAGYRYASVENDILLLELGTQVVVDVIQALSE